MARNPASRKYQLTINNPAQLGLTHECIKQILSSFAGIEYWCMCDEVGKEGTPHTHVYLVSKNAIMFSTLQKRFYGAHIEPANGSNQENRDYIRKEGKWLDDDKRGTNLIGTFEESGELPPDRLSNKKETEAIYEMIKDGKSDYEIMEAFPNAMTKLDKIERTRQTHLAERYKHEFRPMDNTYLYGDTGVGKTRSIMEKFGYPNVHRVTNYAHPFDTYKGQDVIVFEEFRSSLPISEMLIYLDGYPAMLPCRYADKQACYTKVFLVSNIPLEKQYQNVQIESPETWQAFLRRTHKVIRMVPPVKGGIFDWTEDMLEQGEIENA